MKKKLIVSAILTIALCFSLITGATYALFTTESLVNIAINSGKVEMIANITNIETWSLENNKEEAGRTDGTFTLGGSVDFVNSLLTIDKIVPGDKVAFVIEGTNNSNVLVLYRYKIECVDGSKLMSGLEFVINDVKYNSLAKYVSSWQTLNVSQDMDEVEVSIELPESTGNYLQDENTKILVTVEAVQGNANVSGTEEVSYFATNVNELKELLMNKENVVLASDVEMQSSKGGYNKSGVSVNGGVLDGNNNLLEVNNANDTWDCAVYFTGGVIKNLQIGGAFRGVFTAGCNSDLVMDNVIIDNVCYTFSSDGANANYSVIVTNSTLNGWTSYAGGYKSVTFSNCKFGKGNGAYDYAYMRPYSNTPFTNCTFEVGYEFDSTQCTSTFINCYYGDQLITSSNVSTLLGSSASQVVVNNN